MTELKRRDVFQAIADPTRRDIIALLAAKSLNVNEVATHFDISRPAVSKHLKILKECGLVDIQARGRERQCVAHLAPLHEVADWVAQYRQFWEYTLDSFEAYLDKLGEENQDTE